MFYAVVIILGLFINALFVDRETSVVSFYTQLYFALTSNESSSNVKYILGFDGY